jgi:hypothetical protein
LWSEQLFEYLTVLSVGNVPEQSSGHVILFERLQASMTAAFTAMAQKLPPSIRLLLHRSVALVLRRDDFDLLRQLPRARASSSDAQRVLHLVKYERKK